MAISTLANNFDSHRRLYGDPATTSKIECLDCGLKSESIEEFKRLLCMVNPLSKTKRITKKQLEEFTQEIRKTLGLEEDPHPTITFRRMGPSFYSGLSTSITNPKGTLTLGEFETLVKKFKP